MDVLMKFSNMSLRLLQGKIDSLMHRVACPISHSYFSLFQLLEKALFVREQLT